MKNIVVITAVKNECDIIESFCRYTLSFCDCLLIHENHKSSDNTREIVQSLINEGLPIHFEAEGDDIFYEDAKKVLSGIAVRKYNADLIVQLDSDEFLCCIDGGNPRGILEDLDETVEYQVPWRTFVYEKDFDGKGFAPDFFGSYRNPLLEQLQGHSGKAFLSSFLHKIKNAKFTTGAHWLIYPENADGNANGSVSVEVLKSLYLAHYPVRSRRQIMNKAIPNWINKWVLPENERPARSFFDTFQLGILFDSIKETGDISPEIMREASVTYSLFNIINSEKHNEIRDLIHSLGGKLILNGRIDTAFCADLLHNKYAGNSDNLIFVRSTLNIIDKALQNLDDESRQKTHLVSFADDLRLQRDDLKLQLEDMVRHHNELSAHHEETIRIHENLSAHHEETIRIHENLSAHHEETIRIHENLSAHHEELARNYNNILHERDELAHRLGLLGQEHEVTVREREIFLRERDALTAQCDEQARRIEEIYASRSWRIGNRLARMFKIFKRRG